jgi:hypothetical protein
MCLRRWMLRFDRRLKRDIGIGSWLFCLNVLQCRVHTYTSETKFLRLMSRTPVILIMFSGRHCSNGGGGGNGALVAMICSPSFHTTSQREQ